MNILKYLLGLLGLFSVIYCFVMLIYSGPSTSFLPFFIGLGAVCIGGSFILHLLLKHHVIIPRIIKMGISTLIWTGVILFIIVEAFILKAASEKPENGADYVIVLGAQVRGTRLTKSLRYRLDTAVEYLTENPNTKVIVSGGQGNGEDISEAEAMKRYLVSCGIDEALIIMEDQSTNTFENIQYSKNHMKDSGYGQKVIVVTNKFHLYRAVAIAKNQNLEVQGLGAPCDKILAINYYVREFFAVVKYKLSGAI